MVIVIIIIIVGGRGYLRRRRRRWGGCGGRGCRRRRLGGMVRREMMWVWVKGSHHRVVVRVVGMRVVGVGGESMPFIITSDARGGCGGSRTNNTTRTS